MASLLACALWGCSQEQRPLSVAPPLTPPQAGVEDPRVLSYQDNRYQVSQGGRYFVWYGCGKCHVEGAGPEVDLTDRRWRHGEAFADVYRFIGNEHPGNVAYASTIPVEQLWQVTAYVRSLPQQKPEVRHRQGADLSGEPQGSTWSGPLR